MADNCYHEEDDEFMAAITGLLTDIGKKTVAENLCRQCVARVVITVMCAEAIEHEGEELAMEFVHSCFNGANAVVSNRKKPRKS